LGDPSINSDGLTAFMSNYEFSDENGRPDIYARRFGRSDTRISIGHSGEETTGASHNPSISDNSRFVAFQSDANNLIPRDNNGTTDIFVRNIGARTTERVSVSDDDFQVSGASTSPSINANGRYVAFESVAPNLIPGDTNGAKDIFVRDRGLVAGNISDLILDFGARGLEVRYNNVNWQRLHSASPEAVTTGDFEGVLRERIVAAFKGRGILARYRDSPTWQVLDTAVPSRLVAGDLDGNHMAELVAYFESPRRLVVRLNNAAAWSQLPLPGEIRGLQVGDLDGNRQDDLVAVVGAGAGGRLRALLNNSRTWTLLRAKAPIRIVAGDLDGSGEDELIADFGTPEHLLARYNNSGGWVNLQNGPTEGLAVGDLDGNGSDDILVDRGNNGLWALYNNAAPWVKIDNRSPTFLLAADFDGDEEDEIVAGFGGTGVFQRENNSSPFRRLREWPVQTVTAGTLD
jgi:hypothetical protein